MKNLRRTLALFTIIVFCVLWLLAIPLDPWAITAPCDINVVCEESELSKRASKVKVQKHLAASQTFPHKKKYLRTKTFPKSSPSVNFLKKHI